MSSVGGCSEVTQSQYLPPYPAIRSLTSPFHHRPPPVITSPLSSLPQHSVQHSMHVHTA